MPLPCRAPAARLSLKIALMYAALYLTPAQVHSHPLHLTSITVHLEERVTRVTAAVHVAHLGGAPPGTAIANRLRLRLDGVPFRPTDTTVTFNETGETITWQGCEERAASSVAVDAPLFPDSFGDPTVVLVYRNGRLLDRTVVDRSTPAAILNESAYAFSRRFASMGIHHILSGLDHVLFVIGLLLVGGTLRGLLGVITAFTVAHSITLSMTALEIGSLPARFVEPLIALSILAVGAENLLNRKMLLERRMWLAFGFGFFHGFGFAGPLAETGLPVDSVAWSLAAFNLGVEIGQACIVLLAVPILRTLQQQSAVLTTAVTRFASVAIALAGGFWFVERLQL